MPKDATSRACHHVQDYFPNYPVVGSLPCQQACPGMQPTPDAAGQKGEELKQMLNHIEVSGVKQGSRNSGKLRIRPPRLQQPHQEGHPPANCINCIYYHLLNGRMARPCPVFAAPFLSWLHPLVSNGVRSLPLPYSLCHLRAPLWTKNGKELKMQNVNGQAATVDKL